MSQDFILFLHSHHKWKGISFMWKMTFEVFIKSLRFETPWVRKNGFHESVSLSVVHSKKSLSIVKLRSFQNASIEIKQISFVYQQNLFPITNLICEMQKENIFTNEGLFFTLKINPLII